MTLHSLFFSFSLALIQCGGTTHVLRLSWSPDGQYLVSAHAMNNSGPTAQIIERDGWKTNMDFVGHRKAVTVVVSVCSNHSYREACIEISIVVFTAVYAFVFIIGQALEFDSYLFMNSSLSLCRSLILRSLRKNRRMAARPNPAARTAAVLWVVRTAHFLYG